MKSKPFSQDKKYQILLTEIGGAWYKKYEKEATTTYKTYFK